jgi:hypothetical protein
VLLQRLDDESSTVHDVNPPRCDRVDGPFTRNVIGRRSRAWEQPG